MIVVAAFEAPAVVAGLDDVAAVGQSVGIRKGPYFVDVGDFASAGAVSIDYMNRLPKKLAEMTFGSPAARPPVIAPAPSPHQSS
jgi:hypothetical protein